MLSDIPSLLRSAARVAGRADDPNWRPDLSDDQALELAALMGAVVSLDLGANTVTVVDKVFGTIVRESTVGGQGGAMRLAVLRLAALQAALS